MKIAITQLGCIGDLVLATTAIDMIKSKYPVASIDFIVGRKNHIIVKNNPSITDYIVYDKHPIKLLRFLVKFLSQHYDFYIDPKDHYSTESAFLAKIVKANIKIGFNDITQKKQPFDITIPNEKENSNKHFIEQIQNAILPVTSSKNSKIDVNEHNKYTNFCNKIKHRPSLYLSQETVNKVNKYIQAKQCNDFILINISASNTNKMWLPDKWIELIEFIKTQTNQTILLSSDKPHTNIASQIAMRTNVLHFPPSDLQTVIALVSKTNLLISPDTSLVHIASAFNINQIVLANNVPSHLIKFAPLSTVSNVVVSQNNEIYVPSISVLQVKEAFIKMQIQ